MRESNGLYCPCVTCGAVRGSTCKGKRELREGGTHVANTPAALLAVGALTAAAAPAANVAAAMLPLPQPQPMGAYLYNCNTRHRRLTILPNPPLWSAPPFLGLSHIFTPPCPTRAVRLFLERKAAGMSKGKGVDVHICPASPAKCAAMRTRTRQGPSLSSWYRALGGGMRRDEAPSLSIRSIRVTGSTRAAAQAAH
eukprot:124088-Chlamydomonas_euryale.AAC.6